MRWPVVRTIWFREVRDQLRDRRTLFMVLILPLLLYPGLGMAIVQFTALFVEQPVTVGIAGHELLTQDDAVAEPDRFRLKTLPPLLNADHTRFAADLFKDPAEGGLLHVVTGTEAELRAKLQRGEIQAYVLITKEFIHDLKSGKQTILPLRLTGEESPEGVVLQPRDLPGSDEEAAGTLASADDRSGLAHERLQFVFRAWSRQIVKARLEQLGVPPGYRYHQPLLIPRLRPKSEQMWARIFPFLIVMMSMTGALYPAIDVCAGEKERGTMETLLISPASRAEIVCGKFLTVWLFSAITGLLNLASFGFTAWQFSQVLGGSQGYAATHENILVAPDAAALAWCIVLLVPLAAFFSAVSIALAVYARSSKEGQYYLMPLMLVTIPLTVLSALPGVELTPLYSMLPITGPALLLQALIKARSPAEFPWAYFAPVLLPLAAYCYLALHWAVQQFNREEVLFREAERTDLRLMLKRLIHDKQPLPSAGMAMTLFVTILFLQWILSTNLGRAGALRQIALLQVVCVGAPTLLMAVLLTSRPLDTLRLRWPRAVPSHGSPNLVGWLGPFGWLLIGLLLAAALHGPTLALLNAIVDRFPLIKEQLKRYESLLDLKATLELQLLVLAALPAICEELAFRGFILSGLSRRLGVGKAIFTSSLLFAFAHMDAFRFLPTFILGLLLALMATRSGSLWPGVVFHFIHNGMLVSLPHFLKSGFDESHFLNHWLSDEGLYSWPVIGVSAALVLVLATSLYLLPPRPILEEKMAQSPVK